MAEIPKIEPNTPYGMHLDEKETSKLADFVKQCWKDKKSLELTNSYYKSCIEKPELAVAWWQKPSGIYAIIAGSLLVGYVAGAEWQ